MAHSHGSSGPRWGVFIGCAVTLLSCIGFAWGWWSRLDDFWLDFHFRHYGTLTTDPRILLIAIDDGAIRQIGDWPWPRRRYAQIVRTLHDLGAKSILLDIVFAEPTIPRIDDAAAHPHYDVDSAVKILGDPTAVRWIRDDEELRDAISDAGNVYLAMFARLRPPDFDHEQFLADAVELVRGQPDIPEESFAAWLRVHGPTGLSEMEVLNLLVQTRMAAVLFDDISIPWDSLKTRVGNLVRHPGRFFDENVERIARLVNRWKARDYLAAHEHGTWEEFFEQVVPNASFQAMTLTRHDLLLAFRHECSRRAMASRFPKTVNDLRGVIPYTVDPTLPLDTFATAAKGIGLVAFDRAKSGGVVRSLPLLANVAGTPIPQLGLLVALDCLGIDLPSLHYSGSRLIVPNGATGFELPIAADGETLIHWSSLRENDDCRQIQHEIPAAQVLAIPLAVDEMRNNRRRLGIEMAELVRLRHRDTPVEYQDYVAKVNHRIAIEDQRDRLSWKRDEAAWSKLSAELGEIGVEIRPVEEETVQWLSRAYELWRDEVPRDEAEERDRHQILALYEKLGQQQLARELGLSNSHHWQTAEGFREDLRPKVEGKICLVGYTASGVADLVTTPIHSSMPGVMAHANVINMVLQGKPARYASVPVNTLLLAVVGSLVTWFAARGRLLIGVAALITVSTLVAAFGAMMFRLNTYYISSGVALAEAGLVWAFVTAYRQFTEERVRRRFQQALGQYTSPAVAAQIAIHSSTFDLAPRPARVTCFFSDLYGFTELAERLGAARTRDVLNPYLEEVSRALLEHGAMVNKFMGDGVFAFFNAPILPCDKPAKAACMAALDSLRVLDRPHGPGLEGNSGRAAIPAEILRVRIGISTGEAFVGDYGSAAKLDYTCIGDTVNSGARLEAANKLLGTRILVDDATRNEAGGGFLFRPMGGLSLPGRLRPVTAHELVGITLEVNGAEREYAERFACVVRHYQDSEWDSCLDKLAECRRIRAVDAAAERYREAASQYRRQAPLEPWNGSLPLLGR